jgi:hypothetical protein
VQKFKTPYITTRIYIARTAYRNRLWTSGATRGTGIREARELKALEDENRRLKRLVTDPSLDNRILKDLPEKITSNTQSKASSNGACDLSLWAEQKACMSDGHSQPTSQYKPKRKMGELLRKRERGGNQRLQNLLILNDFAVFSAVKS